VTGPGVLPVPAASAPAHGETAPGRSSADPGPDERAAAEVVMDTATGVALDPPATEEPAVDLDAAP
jgi:hypothetical protein